MNRVPIAIACLSILLNLSPLFAGTIAPALQKAVAQASPGEHLAVLVHMAGDHLAFGREVVTPAQRIRAMQTRARDCQRVLLHDVKVGRVPIIAGSPRSFWLANAVAFQVRADMIAFLAERDDVERIELDATVQLEPTVEVKGPAPRGEWTYGLEKLRIPELRSTYGLTGQGVVVGVIDTGVDPQHPDLAGKVIAFKDCVSQKPDAYDDQGHGTHCCGTIAGGASSGTAIGVAPDARLIVAKAFSSSGSAQTSWLLEAMEYMADPDGNPDTNDFPRLVSNSWGGAAGTTTYLESVKAWLALGIFPNFAAGNSGPGAGTVGTPGGFLEAFAVGATDDADKIAYFSSRGPVTWDGNEHVKPDVSAPGKDIYSAKNGGGYKMLSGTSMACPHVSGLLALLYQAAPEMNTDQLRALLEETSVELGETGKDNTFGAGRVDALAAVQIVVSGGKLHGRIVDADTGTGLTAELRIREKDMVVRTQAPDGRFAVVLPEGSYTLEARAFGYTIPAPQTVTVDAQAEIEATFAMKPAAAGRLVGHVRSAVDGSGLAGTLTVLGTPLAPFETASDGSFDISIPAGRYQMLVRSFAHESFTSVELTIRAGASTKLEAVLAHLPPILVVDDDKGKTYERFFTEALDALGKKYSLFDAASGTVDLALLSPYPMVIWFTGDDYGNTLTPSDQDALRSYVLSGGRLFVSGQDIAYDLKNDAFLGDLLGARFKTDNSKAKTVEGQDLRFAITGGTGADNQRYPDAIEAAVDKAEEFFRYGDAEGSAALYVPHGTGRVCYFAFGFEGIAEASMRQAVLSAVFARIAPDRSELLHRLTRFEGDEALAYAGWLAREFRSLDEAERTTLLEEIEGMRGEAWRLVGQSLRMP